MALISVAVSAHPLFGSVFGLSADVSLLTQESLQPVHCIIVLDRSGSMSGSQIARAKEAISAFYTAVLAQKVLASNHLLAFDHHCEDFDLTGRSLDQILRTVDDIFAGGGTSFQAALEQVQKLVQCSEPGAAFFIAFFSDGQDGSLMPYGNGYVVYGPGYGSGYGHGGQGNLQDQLLGQGIIKELQHTFEVKKASAAFHTIGFGADHDATFLTTLTRAGTQEGTFAYLQTSSEIISTMDNIQGLMLTSSFAKLQLETLEGQPIATIQLKLADQPDSSKGADQPKLQCLTGRGHAAGVPATGTTIKVKVGEEEDTVVIGSQTLEQGPLILDTIEYIHQRVRDLTGQVCSGSMSRDALRDIEAGEYAQLRQLLADLDRQACTASKAGAVRKQLRGPVLEAAQLLNQFHTCALAPALTSTLTNEKIASLNALAYKHVTKSRLKSQLEKTAAANVEKLEGLEEELKAAVAKMDLDALEAEPDVEAHGVCNITLQTYVDALRDADCMCLGLDVSRPEAAIADPSRVVIKAILPTFLTAEAFLESVTYALKGKDDGVVGMPEAVHGGFNATSHAKVVPGSANEAVTAVLPLFINRQHWSVARQRLKPVLGWVCTLNILGFSHQQTKVVPFLVLAKALQDVLAADTEFHQRSLKLVLEVCTALYSEGRHIKDELFDADGKLKYLAGPLHRSVDAVPNTGVLLAYLLCAVKAGHMSTLSPAQWQQLEEAVLEEELRRRQPEPVISAVPGSGPDLVAWDVLGISTTHDVMPLLEPVMEADEDAPIPKGEELRALLQAKAEQIEWEQQLISKAADSALQGQEATYRRAQPTLALARYVTQRATSHSSPPETPAGSTALSLKALSRPQRLAVWLQNRRGFKNADRRAWIEEGQYSDPLADSGAVLRREWVDLVLSEVMARFSKLKESLGLLRAEKRARKFEQAQTVEQAAAAARGAFIGKPDLHAMIATLQRPAEGASTDVLKAKMQLLMSGSYEGVGQLFQDKGPVTTWKPSRVNCCRFVRRNWQALPLDEALALFPHLKEGVVREWYARLEAGQGMGNGRVPGKEYVYKTKRRGERKRTRRPSDSSQSLSPRSTTPDPSSP